MKIKTEKIEMLSIEKKISIRSEYYAGITSEPGSGLPLLILSPRGGIDIEAIARKYPEEIFKNELTSLKPYRLHHVIDMVQKTGLKGHELLQTARIVLSLIHCYFFNEALTAEINPLVIDNNGKVIAADAKFEIDDASLFRNKTISQFKRSDTQTDPLEIAANNADVSYVQLNCGDIGVISGGAGLGMATVDMIQALGGQPANFLDLGGDSTRQKTAAALRIVLQTPGVKSVLVNIFGGTNNCETIALGISDVIDELCPFERIVVKMRGHSQDEGWALLEERQIPVIKFGTTEDAVREVL
jgi:succinyl-CoA synthetase beta subunit